LIPCQKDDFSPFYKVLVEQSLTLLLFLVSLRLCSEPELEGVSWFTFHVALLCSFGPSDAPRKRDWCWWRGAESRALVLSCLSVQ